MKLFTRRPAPPAVRPAPRLESTTDALLIESRARLAHAADLVEQLLIDCREHGERGPLRDGLLELRQAVNPAPPVPVVRPAVPVPGRP